MSKMRLRALSIIAILCGLFASLNAQKISVYRNDNNFHQFTASETMKMVHTLARTARLLCPGDVEVPLEAIDSITVRETDVPVLRFRLSDYPDLSWVQDKVNYLPAILDIEGNGIAESVEGMSLTVRGRGNSSWNFPKKPMRMKFSSKTSICGFTKAKNYVLLADHIDPSLMRNASALWIAKRMGVPYTNSFLPCHVYFNDRYAGAYLLTEKIGINKASVDVDEECGMLFELSMEYDEDYKFRSAQYDLPVMVKDPDLEEIIDSDAYPDCETAEDILKLWEADFNEAERKAALGRGDEAFDMRSFVDYLLVYYISDNSEIGWPKSFYMFKEGLGEGILYKFGPVWDFDIGFNSITVRSGVEQPNDPRGDTWLNSLMGALKRSPEFKEIYKERFEYFETVVYPEYLEWLEEYSKLIEPMARLNGLRWPGEYNGWTVRKHDSFDNVARVADLKQWIMERVQYLHEKYAAGEY